MLVHDRGIAARRACGNRGIVSVARTVLLHINRAAEGNRADERRVAIAVSELIDIDQIVVSRLKMDD